MALTLSSAARLANPNFGNIEQLGQDIGSLSARRRQRGMLTDLLGPALDPMATPEQLQQSAMSALSMGQQDLALQLGQMSAAKRPVDLASYYARNPNERADLSKSFTPESISSYLSSGGQKPLIPLPKTGDTTNINLDMLEARETELQKRLGEEEAERVAGAIREGREATQVLPKYAQARAIMEQSGDDITGFGAGALLDARKLVQATYNAFGVSPNDSVRSALDRNVADAELITAFQQDFVTGRLAATKGAISDAEFRAFLASVPGLMTSKEGYISMLNFLEKAAVRAEIRGDYFRMDIPAEAGTNDFKRADKMWTVFSSQFPAGNENTAGIPKGELRQMWNQFRIKNTNEKGLPKQQITALDPKKVNFFMTNQDGELAPITLADIQKEATKRGKALGGLLQEMYADPTLSIQFAPPVQVTR
tara:strand:+ start:1478 stop:2746 length:1269 start_codon:yes stop_codon:yes gene_type:complete